MECEAEMEMMSTEETKEAEAEAKMEMMSTEETKEAEAEAEMEMMSTEETKEAEAEAEAEAQMEMMSTEDLPESCILQILCFTTARDVCRFRAVSQTFRLAGNSDFVWEKMLPIQYPHLLERLDSPLQFSSKRELYFSLCHPNMIDGRTKKFWIERDRGKLCFMLSARDLDISQGDYNHCWHWISQDDSSFTEIAELLEVCRLDVQGQFDCKFLSPGTAYTVSFRLKLLHRKYAWVRKPVKFLVTTPCGDHQESARYLWNTDATVENEGYQMTPIRHVEEGWMEFDAGRFVVEEGEDNPGFIKFCMREWEGGYWQGGLLLGGVKIQPNSLLNERTDANQE